MSSAQSPFRESNLRISSQDVHPGFASGPFRVVRYFKVDKVSRPYVFGLTANRLTQLETEKSPGEAALI